MTKDLVIDLACEYAEARTFSDRCVARTNLRKAIEDLVSEQREACAKLCEDYGRKIHGAGREDSEAFDCADLIREHFNQEQTS